MSEIDTRIEHLVHLANRAIAKANSVDHVNDRDWWLQRSAECEEEAARLRSDALWGGVR